MSFGGGPQAERRLTLQLLAYWEKLRRGRQMPAQGDVSPDDIGDLWEHCFIVHIHEDGHKTMQYLGPKLAYTLAEDMTTTDTILLENSKDKDWFADMLKNPRPILFEGEIINAKGRPVRYRQCLLPLGENGTPTAILGALRGKVF